MMMVAETFPDRRLQPEEIPELKNQLDTDTVFTTDESQGIEFVFIENDGVEYSFHYTDDQGWHECGKRQLEP